MARKVQMVQLLVQELGLRGGKDYHPELDVAIFDRRRLVREIRRAGRIAGREWQSAGWWHGYYAIRRAVHMYPGHS